MRYDLTPSRVFSIPSFWNDDEDWSMLPTANQNSGLSISEDDKHVYVEAAVPGVDPKDVEVTFDRGYVWIKGESKSEEKDVSKKYYRKSASAFSYRVAVPGDIDSGAEPTATYKHGVMKVAFAKAAKIQPKKIQVKSEEK